MKYTTRIFILLILTWGSQLVLAQDPNILLKNWNATVGNNITNVGEIEGRLFVGNNYNISNSHQFGFKLTNNNVNDVVFAVKGSVTTNGQANIKVFYGSASIGTQISQLNWFQMMNGGTLNTSSQWPSQNSPVQALTDASNYWKTLTPNGTIQAPGTQPAPLKFICPANQSLAVFSITDVQSFENSKVQQIEVIPAAATKTIIINVVSIDGTVNWNYGNMVGNFDNEYWRSRIIWNVYTTANNGQMGNMNCMPNMKGALIAPTAKVTGNSNFDGPLFCKDLAITSEIHLPSTSGWQGEAPAPPVTPVCTQTWNGYLGNDTTVCQYTAVSFTTTGTITKTPVNSPAYLQMYWKLTSPSYRDTSTTYLNKWIYSDTTVSITGQWPGILATDTLVQLKVGMRLFDCDMNQLGSDVVKNYTWTTTVCPPPPPNKADIKVIKSVSCDSVNSGEEVTFTIKATNLGPQNATGIKIIDQLPAGLQYISHNEDKGSYSNITGEWNIPLLNNGQTATLNITVKANINQNQNGSLNLGTASPYNLFVFENFTAPSSDVEGRMAVGKNAFIQNYSVGDKLPVSNFGNDDVLVTGGNLTFLSGAVYNGNIVYNGSTNLPIHPVSITGGTLKKDSVIDFTKAYTEAMTLSGQIASMPVNGTTVYQWGGIFLEGTNPVTNVFIVDGSKLSLANDLQIRVPNGAVALVNVIGDTVKWANGFEIFGTAKNNILFNFIHAKKLHIQSIDITGSVLAPLADLTFPSGVINGQVICNSMSGSGQFNYSPFMGNIPADSNFINTTTILTSLPLDPNSGNNSSFANLKVIVNPLQNTPGKWQQSQNITGGLMIMDKTEDNSGNMYLAIQGGKILKSSDNGENWINIQNNLLVSNIWNISSYSDKLFAATEKGVYVSNNAGATWNQTGLNNIDTRDIAIFGNSIYAATWGGGVKISDDNGVTWNDISTGMDCLAVHALTNIGETMFAGTFGGGIYRKLPCGNWESMNIGFEYIWTLAVTPNQTLIAGAYGGGAYRSTDLGTTWTEAFDGLRSRYIYNIYTDASGNIFASGWAAGVFASNNEAESWNLSGLEGLGINLVFSKSNMNKGTGNRIFAASANGNIYYSDSPMSVEDVISVNSFDLLQNYPNPFNPSTTITVSVPAVTNAALTVYNVLGERVAILFNGELKAGTTKFNFSGAGLASGIYFYRLETPSFNSVRKMILTK